MSTATATATAPHIPTPMADHEHVAMLVAKINRHGSRRVDLTAMADHMRKYSGWGWFRTASAVKQAQSQRLIRLNTAADGQRWYSTPR